MDFGPPGWYVLLGTPNIRNCKFMSFFFSPRELSDSPEHTLQSTTYRV